MTLYKQKKAGPCHALLGLSISLLSALQLAVNDDAVAEALHAMGNWRRDGRYTCNCESGILV